MNLERGGVAPPPVPADFGIVAAMPAEVSDLIDGLKKVSKYQAVAVPVIEGECGGKIVAVAIGGPGRPAAGRATEALLTGHRPRWIISAGFAGALNPAFARNDLIVADEIIDTEGGCHRVAVPAAVAARAKQPGGRLLTVDRVVLSSTEKDALRQAHQADLVDMESSAVAALCALRHVPFLSIRVISDDAHADLPREVAGLLSRKGSYRVGAALRAVWQRPSSIKDFWTLYEHSLEAADRLARFIVRSLDDLPS
jgi:adenosylhomocysteine nucleosidase